MKARTPVEPAEPREPVDPALDPCGLEVPELHVREGGRFALQLDPTFARTLTRVSPSEGLEAVGDAEGRFFWAEYGARDQTLTLERASCPPITMPVRVDALEWTKIAAWDPDVEGGPPAREYGAWSIIELGGRRGVLVVGGFHYEPVQFTPARDVWFFDLFHHTWSELPDAGAPLAGGARIAEGPEPNQRLFFGGATLASDGSLFTPRRLQILSWGEEATSWQDAPFQAQAPGSYTGSLVYDAQRQRWLSICGVDTHALGVHCQVSEYTMSGGWRSLETTGEPPPGRFGFHYAYDEDDDRVVIVGGQGAGTEVLGDTWALELREDPARWSRLFEADPKVARRNAAYVFDPIGQRLILWGGTADGRTAVRGISSLRLGRGAERWDHLETPDFVPPRASGFAVYDETNGRAIMGFGNEGPRYTDLYALSL